MTREKQLVAFLGECSLREYIPVEPIRYGININVVVNSGNVYNFKMEVFVGQQSTK